MQGKSEEDEKVVRERINLIVKIIADLEFNEAFNHVINDKMATVKLCDDNWHLIDINDKDKLLELKYAKISAQNMVDTIEIYKQELFSLKEKLREDQNYLDNYEKEEKVEDGQEEVS